MAPYLHALGRWLLFSIAWLAAVGAGRAQSPYAFSRGNIPLSVAQNYLRRSIAVTNGEDLYFSHICWNPTATTYQFRTEQAAFHRFIRATHPKMILGFNLWTTSQYTLKQDCDIHFPNCQEAADSIHALDPEIILGASLDEIIITDLRSDNPAFRVRVPPDLLATYNGCVASIRAASPEYGCLPLALTPPATFDYRAISQADYPVPDQYGYMVDITKDMAQLWYFYLAKRYIDSGFEMLRLGQIDITAKEEAALGYPKTFQLTRVIREYARQHARRGIVLFEEQARSTYFTLPAPAAGQICIFDICGLPLRLHSREIVARRADDAQPAAATSYDYETLIAGGSTAPDWTNVGGGQTAYWGTVAQLPVYTELDNLGSEAMWATTNPAGHAPAPNRPGPEGWQPNSGFPWGWDECTWFYKQSEAYERQWLAATYYQVQYLTRGNGSFCLPVKRPYYYYDAAAQKHTGMFNVYDPASPDFRDLSQAIKTIWKVR